MFHKAIPLLPALNLRATIDFYETRLGFSGLNLGNYAWVKNGHAEIHFYLVTVKNDFHPASCLILCDNVEDLYTIYAGKDMLGPEGKITALQNGKREFSITDNNGNQLRFRKNNV